MSQDKINSKDAGGDNAADDPLHSRNGGEGHPTDRPKQLTTSPSTINVHQHALSQAPNLSTSAKKKSILAGINSQHALALQNQNGAYSLHGHGGHGQSQNYKRIVNIYSVNNYKNKRKATLAPEARLHLNHSVVPHGGIHYDDVIKRGSSESLQLPELPNKPSVPSHLSNY